MPQHPYRRLRPARHELPEVGISESGNIRSLHLGTPTIQSSMNVDYPAELVLSYSRAMMAWLLFVDELPQHITQIGLGGGSFARWIDAYLPETRQTAVDINPQVISIARSMFELPYEGNHFEIIEDDGAEYVKVLRGNTDIILVDGFDGEQIIDSLVAEPFFADCRQALSENGIFVTNWWQGDKRFHTFVRRLREVFENRVLMVPAETHGNIAVLAFQQPPSMREWSKLKKRAQQRADRFNLALPAMLAAIKAQQENPSQPLTFNDE
ncbi:spermidine synthase [Snodgrassella alvi]|uniref:polyamine aminopropyltransferase n=1 Tax=Snodgrassella alvi TaxID=1196083 RepID=UPI000C1DE616|nr:polyamine aminopropyltransferase [Snodgrassella alvi]PIT36307.1 spermidine synthase [Snodgrassella alvi]